MIQQRIFYRNYTFSKHPKQPYYYATVKQRKQSLHRYMYECEVGKIPEGYHIHHKDENPYNNTIDNFELIDGSEHLSMHSKKRDRATMLRLAETGREYAKEWHGSPEGIEWHKNHAKAIGFGHLTYGDHNCEYCGTTFLRKQANGRFCSNNCKSGWRRKFNPDMIDKECEKCKTLFPTRKYLPARFCSRACKPAPNPLGYKARKTPSPFI